MPGGNKQAGVKSEYHNWSTVWQGRDAERLEEISEQGHTRASQYWSSEEERSGEKKRPTLYPVR